MMDKASMRTALSGPLPYVIAAISLMIAILWFVAAGSVIVVDETGGVQAAFVVNSGSAQQRLHGPLFGYLFAVPNMEGAVEVQCGNGLRKQAGYVTGGIHATVRVVGTTPCKQIIDVG